MGRYIADLLRRSNSAISDNIIIPEETFADVSEDFKLIVFASYSSNEFAIFNEECAKLQQICEQYSISKFYYNVRFSNKDKKRWDNHYMNEKLATFKNEIQKIYLVGPVPFMEDIKEAVAMSDLNVADKIFLV
jgi:ferredoxin-NADP reductase